ncbi:hypothetical protein LSCM4_06877 [Leishmania orientalis]|uniref:Uncharacterized protein n=1 Tax=Leishmania orientalis TaxID=2249476 RepID=A0A836GUY4_9TRYP|nr:hypothetical protein LSCM4_06877 [Leishmania orientalis]
MKYILRAVAAAAAFTATLAVFVLITERVPNGSYCGRYASDLVVGNVSVRYEERDFDLTMKGLGMNLNCKKEKFEYDMATHHLLVLGINDPRDCIGSVIKSTGLSLDVTYDPTLDIITLDFGFTRILCKKCATLSYFRGVL